MLKLSMTIKKTPYLGRDLLGGKTEVKHHKVKVNNNTVNTFFTALQLCGMIRIIRSNGRII